MRFEEVLPRLKFTDAASQLDVVGKITADWQASDAASIVHFIYYATFVMLAKDEELQKAMLLADNILVDGIGMQSYFKAVTGKSPSNLNGTDLSPVWIDHLAQKNVPVCFYGTTAENIQKAAEKVNFAHGHNVIAFFQDGFSPLKWEALPDRSALFIGMGTPLQEKWVLKNIDLIREKKLLVISVGGFFDFLSGFYIRAPKIVRALKLEWAWRTMLHPGRHFQKRVRDLTIFYRPVVDRKKGYDKLINIQKVSPAALPSP